MNSDDNHRRNWDFSQIDDYIFLGADLCCGSLHYDYLVNVMGIRADINLRAEEEFRPSSFLEHYLWLPVENNRAPSLSQLRVGVGVIDELVKQKKRIFVHCMLGHGRSPTLAAAFFVLCKHIGVEKAVNKLKRARPEIHINKEQMKVLLELRK